MPYRIRILMIGAACATTMFSQVALGDQVSVTTYVTKVQEERQSTRWTLTEWLRIKERMKLMDVWLAMFSDPKKDRFRPEFNLAWLVTRSSMERRTGDSLSLSEGTASGHTGRAQFWATNLVSSTLGIRTVNIDFGIEGGQHDSGVMVDKLALTPSDTRSPVSAKTTWYTGNLRLFGKNIQDSSLVIKYGMMQTTNSLQLPSDEFATTNSQRSDATLSSGTMAGAELQLYLFKWLGVEGTYHAYSPIHVAYSDHTLEGQYGEALGFIEISVLRLMVGRYEEQWDAKWDTVETRSREWGYLAGLKVQI